MDPVAFALLLAVVFFANIYASSVGGASMLILPAMLLAGVPPHVAVATNRFHRIFASGAASYKYLRNVRVEMKRLFFFATVSVLGAVIGAFIVISIDEALLEGIVAVALLVLSVFFLAKKDLGLKTQRHGPAEQNTVIAAIVFFVIGIYRSIIGSASGTFLRVYLITKEKLDFLQGATYASVISVPTNLFASIVFVAAGIVDFWLALGMIVVGIAGSYLGAHIAIKKGNEFVRKIFLLLAIVTSARILAGVLFGI